MPRGRRAPSLGALSPRGTPASPDLPYKGGGQPPRANGEEGVTDGGGTDGGVTDALTMEEERTWLEEAARGFDSSVASLGEAAAARKEVLRGVSDVLWQLKRANPDERLEAKVHTHAHTHTRTHAHANTHTH